MEWNTMDVTENLLDEWLWQKKSWFKKDAEKPLPLYNVHSRREKPVQIMAGSSPRNGLRKLCTNLEVL